MTWLKKIWECVKGWFENNQEITLGVLKKLYENKDNFTVYIGVEESFAKDLGTNLERLKHIIELMIDAGLISVQALPGDASKNELRERYQITDGGMAYFSQKSLEEVDKHFRGWVLKHIPIIVAIVSFIFALIALCS